MNWNPKREKRVKRHSLGYRVPKDRQLVTLEVPRPGDVTLVTDTLYVVRCPSCEKVFNGATEWESTSAFSQHNDDQHPNMPNQHEVPDWFRTLMEKREADIAKLQYNHEDHDY